MSLGKMNGSQQLQGNKPTRIASIDLGTNTILLLIAEIRNCKITPLYNAQSVIRLGKKVDASGFIQKDAFGKTLSVISEFKTLAERFKVDKIIAIGTSALRDAKNKDEFVRFIFERTGVQIEVIPGEKEARLTYLGAVSGLSEEIANSKITVIDIGGGSTEIINGHRFEIQKFESLNIGTVRITEKFLKHSPPLEEEINIAKEFISTKFDGIEEQFDFKNSTLIGVAATVTTIAAYDLNLKIYDGEKVNGHKISFKTIEAIFNTFKNLSAEEIKQIPQVSKGREDVIFAGILILREFMKRFNFSEVIASDRGVRYGAILEFLWKSGGIFEPPD